MVECLEAIGILGLVVTRVYLVAPIVIPIDLLSTGWEKHYSGLSDSDLPSIGHDPLTLPHSHAHRMHRQRKGHLSPDKDVLGDLGDSDMESIASVTSSAFSTQSERPRGSRALM